jgi:hypothetical protein
VRKSKRRLIRMSNEVRLLRAASSRKELEFDARHRHDECMKCSVKPEYEVLWAEGMAHAWFCEKHLKEWLKNQVAECAEEGFSNKNCSVDSVKKLDNKEASKKFGDNRNPNILDSFLSKITMPAVNKERKREMEEEMETVTSVGVNDSEELAPVNPSGVELGEEITVEEIKKYFKSFYRTKPYISLVGGICNWGKTKGDVDVFINAKQKDEVTELRIIRMFPREYWPRFRFMYPGEVHPGKFTNYIDIFNEKIEVISGPKLELMSAAKKVELFKFFPLLKPMVGKYEKGEEYTIDNLISVVNDHWDYSRKIAIQRKYDGWHVVAMHSKEGKVKIFTEHGHEITDKCPTIAGELKDICKGHDVIVPGELESWEKGKHNPRQKLTSIIHSKGFHACEESLRFNIFDCLYFN